MRVWVYRPDYKIKELDYTLLYYKGITADQYIKNSNNNKPKIKRNPKIKSHSVEVPN